MLTLTVLAIGLGCVSAENLEDTNSTTVSIDENSQLNEIKDISFDDNNLKSDDDELLEVSKDSEDTLEAGDVSLSIVNGKSSYSTSDSVTVKMGTYSMASSSDQVSVYLNNRNIATTSYGTITGSGFAVPLASAQTGSNSIYCSFTASGIWTLTSDTVTVNIAGGGPVNPVEEGSVTISIYDMAHPGQSTITSNGDYVSDIAYTITKTGDGFSGESLEVIVNGQSKGFATPNSSNRLGKLTFTEDSEWTLTVVYTATYNGKTVTATSNKLTFITRNTSGGGNGSETPEEGSATISIYDMAYPGQSTITSNGDYVSDIAYTITKSGDGFTDESLEVIVNGQSKGFATPNSSNRLGKLTFTEDNDWTLTVVYTATYNGKTVTATSNALTFITRNTSGGGNSSTNGTGDTNGTGGDDPQPGAMQVIIRDANHPNEAVIYLTDKYNAAIEYYVTLPSGDLITNDLIIKCNGESVTTLNPVDKTYTTIGGTLLLNETGDYVFTATYMYWSWGVENGEIESNSITYHVIIYEEPVVSISVNNVFYPNKSTATVTSNVDGVYIVTIDQNNYEVTVAGGKGTVDFSLPEGSYTADVVSKSNSSLKNSTSFSVFPKGKTTPSISCEELIDGEKATIFVTLPSDINDEKITVTLNGKTSKEATVTNGKSNVEFADLEDGDYSYEVIYPGNDDYGRRSYYGSFTVQTLTPITNETGNSSGSGNGTGPNTNGSSSNTNQSGFEKSSIDAIDLTRGQNSPYDFKATFYDKNGNPLANTDVNFIVNGNDNIVKTDEYGVAKLVNRLAVGKYEVVIRNYATGELQSKSLTIVGRITGNANINVDYTFTSTYRVRVFADNGQAVGAGEKVIITINGQSSTLVTDKDGYVSYIVSGLLPKTYSITAEYKGSVVSNSIVVKQILKAKNAKFKKSKKVKKFKVTLKTSSGKAIKGKKITLKVKGKTYKAKTNKKGVATFKIKNLKKAGKFKATIKYLKTSIKKTITVRR